MRVFEVHAEMISPVEFLRNVAFTEFVMILKVGNALVPVVVRRVSSVLRSACPVKIHTTEPTRVSLALSGFRVEECSVVAVKR